MDAGAEEEQHHNPFLASFYSTPRFQFRSEVSKARWDESIGMGEIIEKKGRIWTSTGMTRNGGKLYCTIEEIIFLVERGALLLLDTSDRVLDLKYIYMKLAEGKCGCTWESLEAYRHLKSLGYIIRRHGIPWTMKNEKSCCPATSHSAFMSVISDKMGKSDKVKEEDVSIVQMVKQIAIDEMKLDFDVYLPDSKFRKTSPGDPNFILSLLGSKPPSRADVEGLEKKCNGVPLKFCHVDHGRVSIFSFEKLNLQILP
ncbi:unnamed protein product [Spirodela intermedia]|uniref:tRNA-splicing endonuclease subunit Sen54 N-terminal domain-containing protein n=1 Tax=Spirodela intermedia TaxID=51605 RepID=A0A7I8ITZ3_SPIIN|nr:unnamed protein product [Spirodela intermedia]CAA6661267.1 unnamed protein product [Spirodela intermedia]